ncbi:hypothetical protein Tco_1351896 [Tanacetum coccineum]
MVSHASSALNLLSLQNTHQVPTSVNEKGDEVVVFDEELVREGCKKWKNTVCGYFIGCSMPVYEVKYNLRRMQGEHGLKEIISDDEGLCFVKFKSEEGLNFVIDQSPWMVNEAWSTKGTRTLSSRLGRPTIMDQMTADMCNKGTKRLRYARILVEIEATKGLPNNIEINYVFGHNNFKCAIRPRTIEEIEKTMAKINIDKWKFGFEEVGNKRDKGKDNGGNFARKKYGYQRPWNDSRNFNTKVMFRPKVPNAPVEKEIQNDKDKLKGKDVIDGEPPSLEKVYNIGRLNVNKLRRSTNKYVVLSEDNDESCSWEAMERRENENSDEEDVWENPESVVQSVIAYEVIGKGDGMGNIC